MKEFTNTKKSAHFDALGDPIQINKAYGWSRNDGGLSYVTIGIAEKFSEKGVTFKVISAKKSLYDYDPEPLEIGGKDFDCVKQKVNIKGMMVFPIPPKPTRNPGTFVRGNNNGFAHLDDIELD